MTNQQSGQADSLLSKEERKSIYSAWPYSSSAYQLSDLVELRTAILSYFGVHLSFDLERPQSIRLLLDQLREIFGIVDISFSKSSSHSLTGDSGLILFCSDNSFYLIKPDRWFRHDFPRVDNGTIILLIHSLPPQSASLFQLFKRIIFGRLSQFITIISVVLVAVLISLIPTWLKSYVFDSLIPDGLKFLLLQLSAFLLMLHLTTHGLKLFNQWVAIRLELILGFNLSSILIYRLINLPASFFTQFNLGDLQQRIGSAHAVRRALQGSLVAFVTSIFTVTLNILLVYFKSKSLLMCFYLVVFTLFGPFVDVISACLESYFRYQRLAIAGSLQDAILFPLQSLSTIRSLGIESDVFSSYSKLRLRLARIEIKVLLLKDILKVFSLVLSAFIISFLFYMLSIGEASDSSTKGSVGIASQGMIVLLLSSFSTINAAVRNFSTSLLSLVKIIPDILRFRPVVKAQYEPSFKFLKAPIRITSLDAVFHAQDSRDNQERLRLHVDVSSNLALFDEDKGTSTELMNLLNDFVLNNKQTFPAFSHFTVNKSISIESSNANEFCRNSICIDTKIVDFPGTVLENITDFLNHCDRAALMEILSLFDLPSGDVWLNQEYNHFLSSSSYDLRTANFVRLMIIRALYCRFDILLLNHCIDNLNKSEITSLLQYCKTASVLLVSSTSDPSLPSLFDQHLEIPSKLK